MEVVTEDIDYFAVQAELADVSAKLTGFGDDTSPFIQVMFPLVLRIIAP